MLKLLVIPVVVLMCLVLSCRAKPTTVKRTASMESFNTTQLITTVNELRKEPGKFRRVATVSLLIGAIRSEEQMEKELTKLMNDLLDNFNTSTMAEKEKKLKEISRFIQRDFRAMFILSSAIDLTQYNASIEEFRNSMREFALHGEQLTPKLDMQVLRNGKTPIDTIRNFVHEHIQILRSTLINRVGAAIDTLQTDGQSNKKAATNRPIVVASSEDTIETNTIPLKQKNETSRSSGTTTTEKEPKKKKGNGMVPSRTFLQGLATELNPVYYIPYQEEIENHFKALDRFRRGDDEGEEFEPNDEGPGGLVGLIANLSGGDEGSDVGAVIGALTGVVARLLGPGGLDINGLLSTGTGLLAGLLGGDENFGTVLSRYVGTSLDGFSGGGGADNNGMFVGHLVGGVVAALSADPEDEDENPIKPGIFIQNLLMSSFGELAKGGGEEEGEERRDRKDRAGELRREGAKRMMTIMRQDMEGAGGHGGSDVFGFIVGLIKGVVGGVKSIIVNSLAGLSSGASKGSMDLASKTVQPLFKGSDGLAAALTT